MLLSMTGFGRGVADGPCGRLIAEIQAVNRKYLEIFVSLPKEFARFEQEIRKWVGETLSRGQITVRIHWMPGAASLEGLLPNVEMLRNLKTEWEKIAHQLGFDPKKIDLPFLMQHLPVLQKVDLAQDQDMPVLHLCVKEALQALTQMKKKEGKALAQDLSERLKELAKKVSAIEKLAPDASQKMRQKLLEKMGEVMQPGAELDERIFREVAIFAERVDIAEEVTRLKSHFAQFEGFLSPKEGVVGRKMDFLIQEMGRETNTIGSKSMDAHISHLVVEMKSELEKMREQIQNIE